jgi:hypothetical protein
MLGTVHEVRSPYMQGRLGCEVIEQRRGGRRAIETVMKLIFGSVVLSFHLK